MTDIVYHNKALADKQGLSQKERIALEVIYNQMHAILARPGMYGDPQDIPDIISGFEYVLQALWHFPMESKFHRYQLEIAGCTCPTLDNYELIGYTRRRHHNSECPFHGSAL